MYEVVDSLDRDICPSEIDSVSAPMLGINLRIAAFHLSLSCSLMKNLTRDDAYSCNNNILLMFNPVVTPEAHAGKSLQYEFDFLEGCKTMRLVERMNFVRVEF